jgi:hypothetical protein
MRWSRHTDNVANSSDVSSKNEATRRVWQEKSSRAVENPLCSANNSRVQRKSTSELLMMWGRYPHHRYLPHIGDLDVITTTWFEHATFWSTWSQQQIACSHFATAQHCSQTCTVNCKGNGHNWHQHRRPTSPQLPAANSSPTSQVSAGSSTTGFAPLRFPRKLIPQRRSWLTTTPAWLMVPPILTHGWLPLSLNLGLRRNHTACNPSSQDTDDELQTLMASNIALRLEKQDPGAIVSTHRGPPAGQPRPYVSAPLRLQVFHHRLRLHRPDHVFRSPPTLPPILERLRNTLRGEMVWQPRTRWLSRHRQHRKLQWRQLEERSYARSWTREIIACGWESVVFCKQLVCSVNPQVNY